MKAPLKLLLAALIAASALPAFALGQRADLRIHDRDTGRELPVHWHQGQAYVVGQPGNEYQVSLRNKAGEDLLAVVSVDGVNVVSGQTAHPHQGGYVLTDWQRLDIKGWRKSLDHTAAFYFTSLGDSYAGRTGRPDNVGVIGVALFQRKPEPRAYDAPRYWNKEAPAGAAPRAEAQADSAAPQAKRHALPAPSAPLGTGHGRNESSPVREVGFERASDWPVETITIRYDSYRNLLAQGVLTQPVARRSPEAFPGGFVPDPVGVRSWRDYR